MSICFKSFPFFPNPPLPAYMVTPRPNFSDKFERYMKKEIEEMITYAGDPNYLLYGTDWPISNMGSYLKFMGQLELADEKKELILWKNAAQLFKIDIKNL